jgi:hypothetical protein
MALDPVLLSTTINATLAPAMIALVTASNAPLPVTPAMVTNIQDLTKAISDSVAAGVVTHLLTNAVVTTNILPGTVSVGASPAVIPSPAPIPTVGNIT